MQASSKDRQRGGWKEQDHRVIVSNMENPFFFDIYKTIEAEAHTNGYERGLRVPEDVSVTGFDNVKRSKFLLPCSDYRAHPARSRRSHHVRFPDRTAERRRNHCGNCHRSRTCFARLHRSRERNALVKWGRRADLGCLQRVPTSFGRRCHNVNVQHGQIPK